MNYCEIKPYDISNGEGVRVSLFVSGCTHRCKGCFNEETWDFNYGKPFTEQTEAEIIGFLKSPYVNGLTLLGGEPLEKVNQEGVLSLLKKVKESCPDRDIWCYTGYTLEKDLLGNGRARCNCTDEILSLVDVLVDGEFILELKNISLLFRGSENQRIIDLPSTLSNGKTVIKELKMSKI